MPNLASNIVNICKAELGTFKGGTLKENHAEVYKRVGTYWASIPVPGLDGRTQLKDKKGKPFNPAWSAAFISFVLTEAGAGNKFKPTNAHCHYVEAARIAAANNANKTYHATDPYSGTPAVGDILVAGREYADELTFKQAELAYKADGYYPSHGDFVVEVDQANRWVVVVGGNVGDSVSAKRLFLNTKGRLADRVLNNRVLPWLALLRLKQQETN